MTRHDRAVLYDFFQVAGGAERFSLAAAEALGGCEIVVARTFPASRALGYNHCDVTSLGNWCTKSLPRVIESIACFKYRASFLKDVNLALYSGIYAPLAVKYQVAGTRIYYCHTPPRYAYDMRDAYRAQTPILLRPILSLLSNYLASQYENALSEMDFIFSNSLNVQQRLKAATGFDSKVLYPPVDTQRFQWSNQEDYFLSLGRLEPKKNVELIVKAFLKLPSRKLFVSSGGSQLNHLKKLAAGANNIIFTGWQSESALRELVGRCLAAIYIPDDEDFGMSPVEAMAAGKPVVGCAKGGLLETVLSGETGILIPAPLTEYDLINALISLTPQCALSMRAACEARAEMFSKKVFSQRLNAIL